MRPSMMQEIEARMSQGGSDALRKFGSFQRSSMSRRKSALGRTMSGLRGSVAAEIIEDREAGEHLSRVKLAQGAAYRQSVCIQGRASVARQMNSDIEKGLSSERAAQLL